MDSKKLQEILISTIENVAKNVVLDTNYLTLITGQISHVDQFNNYYNFTYQNEEYTGFSITGEKYEYKDLVYVLKLNNDVNTKHMIISKVNNYSNFDINDSIKETIEDLKNYVDNNSSTDKEIAIIGNTTFILNDDLTITPEELSFSAQKSSNIEDIKWFVDGLQQEADQLKRLTIPNSIVQNKDNVKIRVEDASNSDIYDEVTVIRAMNSDTKLDFDLGIDSILLTKDEQGIIDYSKAIIIPKVYADGVDDTANGWTFDYTIEVGELTIIKSFNQYKITNIDSNIAKLSFFARKNGNMYMQKVIYIKVVSYSNFDLTVSISNQNFVIPLDADNLTKEIKLSSTISAKKGNQTIRIYNPEAPSLLGIVPIISEQDDQSVIFEWNIPKGREATELNGTITLNYTIDNEDLTSNILWSTTMDGADSNKYTMELTPKNVLKNGDDTLSSNTIKAEAFVTQRGVAAPYNGKFKIYTTIDGTNYNLVYNSTELESVKIYTIDNVDIKSVKFELYDENDVKLITEYVYITINGEDFVETVNKTSDNESRLTVTEEGIEALVGQTDTIEKNITNLTNNTNQKFTEIDKNFTSVNQTIGEIKSTAESQNQKIEEIDGTLISQEERLNSAEEKITPEAITNTVTSSETWRELNDNIVEQGERLTTAEQKITADAIVSTVTSSTEWGDLSNNSNTALQNSKSIQLNASSTAFSKTKDAANYIPSNIIITPSLKSYTFGKYQYATAIDDTYFDIINGQHGFTLEGTTLTISNDSDLFTSSNNIILIKGITSDGSAYDTVTIIKIADGTDGSSGGVGKDAYSIVIGNENFSISCLNNGNTASAETLTIPIYTCIGTARTSNSISVTGLPNGITSTVTNGTNNTDGKIILTIAANNNLDGLKNGTIKVNITVNGVIFEKQINWSKAIAGEDGNDGINSYTHIRYSNDPDGANMSSSPSGMSYIGIYTGTSPTAPADSESYMWSKYKGENGATGNGINSITYYYKITTTQTPPSAASITSTTIPVMDAINKYLWQKEVIDFTDSSVADKTSVILMAVYGNTGESGNDGRGIKSTNITYQGSSSGTTIPTGVWTTSIPEISNGQYLWTRTIVTYTDETTSTSYSVAYKGTNGQNGEAGRTYFIEPSTVIIKKGKDNKLSPTNVVFSAYYRDGSNVERTAYSGRFIIQESYDGNIFTTKYTSLSNEATKTYTPTITAKIVKCTLYVADGTDTILDVQTVAIVEDIDGVEIGGKNLILDSAVEYSNTSYPTNIYTMSEKMSADETYTIRIWGELGEGKTHFAPYLDGGNIQLGSMVDNGDGTYSVTFTGKAGSKDPSQINVYPMPASVTDATSTITKIKLEKGNVPTDWTPAPEDTALSIDEIHNQLDGLDNIITNTQTNFEQKIDSITATVSQTQEAIVNYGDQLTQIRTDISTEIEQVASGLNVTIEEIYNQFSDLGDVTETIRTFFRVTSDGLMITQDGNPTATLMGYDHFAVLLNDSEVVKIYQDSMQAPNGIFDSSVTIGPIKYEGYSEGVALKWVG